MELNLFKSTRRTKTPVSRFYPIWHSSFKDSSLLGIYPIEGMTNLWGRSGLSSSVHLNSPPLLTVKGDAMLPVQRAGQRVVDANAVVIVDVALRRGHGGGDGSEGLSGRNLCAAVFVFVVPKGRSPGLRDGPWHVLLLIIHPTPQR